MGYSNNKWRKLLTFLMIINLCFVLFAKFSRVFAEPLISYDTAVLGYNVTLNDYTLKLPSFVFDYDYQIFTYNQGTWTVIISNNELVYGAPISSGNNAGKHFSVGTKNYLVNNIDNGVDNLFYRQTFNGNNLDKSNITLNDFQKIYSYNGSVDNSPDYSNVYFCSNFDVYDINDDLLNSGNPYHAPYFENVTEIENGYPDGVFISPQDYGTDDNLYFHLLSVNNETVSTPGNSVFYYSDNIFELNKNSEYYKFFEEDTEKKYAYYYIPRYKLSFNLDTSYVYVLSSSSEVINNSYNHIQEDVTNGVYDVIESDTTGVMTSTDLESDRLNRIEEENINQANNTNSINNSLTNTTPDVSTGSDIDSSLNFDNSNDDLSNLNNGFFSRLNSMLSNLLGYNLSEDTSVSIPLPNSNKTIDLHSKVIYDNVTGVLRLIVNAFWVYIFSFYMWKFINKIYIAVSTGHILDTFSSSGEAITNDML